MKLSKQELLDNINDLEVNDDIKISLMENISDSFEPDTTELDEIKSKYETLKTENDDLRAKYKERFLSGENKKIDNDFQGLTEKNYVDIKEI